jgi:hypothetical protein
MRTMFFAALLVFAGCNGDDTDTDVDTDTDTDSDSDSDSDADSDTDLDTGTDVTNTWSGEDNGWDVPSGSPDDTFNDNIWFGTELSDFTWATSSYTTCFPGNDQSRFAGRHVGYFGGDWLGGTWDGDQSAGNDVYVRVVPNDGVDLSVYVMTGASLVSADVPPGTVVEHVAECDAVYDASGNNPGQPEVVCMNGFGRGQRNVIIGVAGVSGTVAGPYRIEIWEETSTNCSPSR